MASSAIRTLSGMDDLEGASTAAGPLIVRQRRPRSTIARRGAPMPVRFAGHDSPWPFLSAASAANGCGVSSSAAGAANSAPGFARIRIDPQAQKLGRDHAEIDHAANQRFRRVVGGNLAASVRVIVGFLRRRPAQTRDRPLRRSRSRSARASPRRSVRPSRTTRPVTRKPSRPWRLTSKLACKARQRAQADRLGHRGARVLIGHQVEMASGFRNLANGDRHAPGRPAVGLALGRPSYPRSWPCLGLALLDGRASRLMAHPSAAARQRSRDRETRRCPRSSAAPSTAASVRTASRT